MEGTPAGWYDDPEQPGQQRYWDGTAWTENRAPTTAPTPAPPSAPAPPPATAPPASSSNRVVWIIVAVLGVIAVLVVVAILAVTFFGDSTTDVVEENLPAALESNYSAQGLEVTVSKVDCDSISGDDGPFTTTCAITIDGLSEPLTATVTGSVDGNTVSVDDVSSEQTVIDESLAQTQAQTLVDSIEDGFTVTSCTLAEPVVLVTDSLTFDCTLDSDETVTFGVQDGQLVVQDVS